MSRRLASTVIAFTIVVAGCATTKQREPVASRYRPQMTQCIADDIDAVPPPPVEHSPAPVQLASARQQVTQPPHSDADNHHQHRAAGNKFLPPPPVPAAPAEIALHEGPDNERGPLTLETLEALACQYNPTLLQAQGQVEGELGKAIQAGLWPNPTLSYVQEQIGVKGTPGEFVGGTVRQRIVTGHKLDLSRAKFLASTQAAEWHALEQQYRVLNDVRIHYFRARGRYELVLIHRELLKTAEDNVLTQRERYNVGQATRADVHLANVALQRARLDLLRADNEYRQSFEVLTALVGANLPLAPLATPLEGDLTPFAYEDALAQLLTQSPQVQAALNKLESDRITIRRELVEPVPDIVVEGGAGYNFDADETVASARASIEIPLFDWNQGTIRQAEADYVRQQGEVRRIELSLKQELARTYQDYLTALQFAGNYAEVILPEARTAYELQLRSYKDDRIPWVEVLNTQREYFTARTEYIRNLIMWREAEVLISGFLLHGGLQAPTAPPPPGHINAVPKPR